MGQGRAQIYNLISILFLVLTIGAAVLIGARLVAPPPAPTEVAFNVPTSAVLPTITPSLTPTITPSYTPTFTLTPSITPSISPTVTWTLIPSLTASLTPTIIPSLTPSLTLTPEPSLTITTTLPASATSIPTVTPVGGGFIPENTVPPPSPYPFILRDQVIYTSNFANTAQCAWQGIGGQVFDVNGQPLVGMRIHVFGNGIDLFTTSGTNTLYGLSGWEVPLNTMVTSNSYLVELQTSEGTIVSPQTTISFEPDCTKNLALVNFAQTRAF